MSQLTEKVIRGAFTVSNTLGCGFLEKVYENALAHELRKAGMQVEQQYGITVYFISVYPRSSAVSDMILVDSALEDWRP